MEHAFIFIIEKRSFKKRRNERGRKFVDGEKEYVEETTFVDGGRPRSRIILINYQVK